MKMSGSSKSRLVLLFNSCSHYGSPRRVEIEKNYFCSKSKPVKVINKQGRSISTVENLPARKRGSKALHHRGRVVVVVEGRVLFHIELLNAHLGCLISQLKNWIKRVHTGILLLMYPWLVSSMTKLTKASKSASEMNVFLNSGVYQSITLYVTNEVESCFVSFSSLEALMEAWVSFVSCTNFLDSWRRLRSLLPLRLDSRGTNFSSFQLPLCFSHK